MFHIEEELKKLPSLPGVYMMHDRHDTIIYVGTEMEEADHVILHQPEKQGAAVFSEKPQSGN